MSMKKILAVALSATMITGMTVPAMAGDVSLTQPPAVDAPIYSLDIVDVVIPTQYAVAFNPGELSVYMNSATVTGSGESTAQILSKSYGIVNKGSKDQVIKVALKVEDLNAVDGKDKIEFVKAAADVDAAKDGEYKIHLTAIPADTTAVAYDNGSAMSDAVTAGDLSDVKMTGAAAAAVTLNVGDNQMAFKLNKASFVPKGNGVELGTTTAAQVNAAYELDALAANGKGVTAFTFGGKMNKNAEWGKLTAGIKITPTYSVESVPASGAEAVSGTGAMVKVGPSVTISTSGLITVSGLTADKNYKSMTVTDKTGKAQALSVAPATWNTDNWNSTDGGTFSVQLGDKWVDYLVSVGGDATVKVVLSDNTEITSATVSVTK